MWAFAARILGLSIFISVITAALVFVSLNWLMVRPMRRITQSMLAFRQNSEDTTRIMRPWARRDEIGAASRELAAMQRDLHGALRQKTRLAALGTAVSKISHDLRNILATAQLVSDRLAASADPEVRRSTPVVLRAIDRAINLCEQTLRYGRAEDPVPVPEPVKLSKLVDDVGSSLGLTENSSVAWHNTVDGGLTIRADREQMFRVLLNLGRNAVEAILARRRSMSGAPPGEIHVRAARRKGRVRIAIVDNGPGLPPAARERPFEPFAGAARNGGVGLGLSIARDIMRAHGGDVHLRSSGADGTVFELELPDR